MFSTLTMLFTMVNFPVDFVSWHDSTLAKYCFSKVYINGLLPEILGGPQATHGGDSCVLGKRVEGFCEQ